jgi:hypothetical protein
MSEPNPGRTAALLGPEWAWLRHLPDGTRFVDRHQVSVWNQDLGAAVPMAPPTTTDNLGDIEWTIAILPPHGAGVEYRRGGQ